MATRKPKPTFDQRVYNSLDPSLLEAAATFLSSNRTAAARSIVSALKAKAKQETAILFSDELSTVRELNRKGGLK